jgi:hypothetical protein
VHPGDLLQTLSFQILELKFPDIDNIKILICADTLPPLKANVVLLTDPDDDKIGIYLPEDNDNMLALLPPEFTILNPMGTEPASINEAL